MRKVILMIDQDETAKRFVDAFKKIREYGNERFKFVQKQIEGLQQKVQEEQTDAWDAFEVYLKDKKLLPKEYNPKIHRISVEAELGILFIEDRDQPDTANAIGFKDFMKMLFPS